MAGVARCVPAYRTNYSLVHVVAASPGPVRPLCAVAGFRKDTAYRVTDEHTTCRACLTAWTDGRR